MAGFDIERGARNDERCDGYLTEPAVADRPRRSGDARRSR